MLALIFVIFLCSCASGPAYFYNETMLPDHTWKLEFDQRLCEKFQVASANSSFDPKKNYENDEITSKQLLSEVACLEHVKKETTIRGHELCRSEFQVYGCHRFQLLSVFARNDFYACYLSCKKIP